MGAALAFYGALALSGLGLLGLYIAGAYARHGASRAYATGQTARAGGSHDAAFVDYVLRQAAARHDSWIAAAVGALVFLIAIAMTALQLQRMIDAFWPKDVKRGDGARARHHAPEFLAVYALALLLALLLFAGATIHGLMSRTHGLSLAAGLGYQALDVGASIVVLTFVFLVLFAYLPATGIPWKTAWIAAFLSAILYERGQFGLSFYFGQMDARSPYADAGALLAIVIWLYYSAGVVTLGAALTKVLAVRVPSRTTHSTPKPQRRSSAR
jgi:membrane protein